VLIVEGQRRRILTLEEAEAVLSERSIAVGSTLEEAVEAIEHLGFTAEIPSEMPMGHQLVRVHPPAEYGGVTLSEEARVTVDVTAVDSAEQELVNTIDSQWSARDGLIRAFAQALLTAENEAAAKNR
jgi:hypothetical protein